MKNTLISTAFVALIALCACSQTHQTDVVYGINGKNGVSMGVDVSQTAPSCVAGGVTVKTFVDANDNSELDLDETVKKVAVICNGTNGTDGTSVSVSTASVSDCVTGGVVVTAGLLSFPICNGADGAMGPQGEQGIQGAQGPVGVAGQDGKSAYEIWKDLGNTGTEEDFLNSLIGQNGTNGTDGTNGLSAYQIWLNNGNTGTEQDFLNSLVGPRGATGEVGPVGPVGPQGVAGGVGNVTPVQLCPGDTVSFKEYGLVVGSDLFAVYFDKNQPIANGSSCYFSYQNNGTTITLTNTNNTTLVTTVNIGSSSSSSSITGTCLVKKVQDYGTEKHYSFTLSGSNVVGDYLVEINMSNNSASINTNNNGYYSFTAGTYSFTPINSATSFTMYSTSNATSVVQTAKVVKVSNPTQTLTCTVDNTI